MNNSKHSSLVKISKQIPYMETYTHFCAHFKSEFRLYHYRFMGVKNVPNDSFTSK
jgi:hypothetical protein